MIIKLSIYFVIGLTLLVSYLLGCFNGAVVTSHFIIRDDVRKHGSGNAGLTNFYRTYGAKYALIVIACDMGKTLLSCLIGGYLMLSRGVSVETTLMVFAVVMLLAARVLYGVIIGKSARKFAFLG